MHFSYPSRYIKTLDKRKKKRLYDTIQTIFYYSKENVSLKKITAHSFTDIVFQDQAITQLWPWKWLVTQLIQLLKVTFSHLLSKEAGCPYLNGLKCSIDVIYVLGCELKLT